VSGEDAQDDNQGGENGGDGDAHDEHPENNNQNELESTTWSILCHYTRTDDSYQGEQVREGIQLQIKNMVDGGKRGIWRSRLRHTPESTHHIKQCARKRANKNVQKLERNREQMNKKDRYLKTAADKLYQSSFPITGLFPIHSF
jgi:hypothetical protein